MEFGPVPLDQAGGAILAHSAKAKGRKIAKGTVLGPKEIEALAAEGFEEVVVARPGPEDVAEDLAAERLARALVPDPEEAGLMLTAPHAGRVNLKALGPGIATIDVDKVHALNRVDPAITLATVAPHVRVAKGTLVGTVKIISYAVPGAALDTACAAAAGALAVRPVALRSAGLMLTEVPGQAGTLNEKGRKAVEGRLRALGIALADCVMVPHEREAMAAALERLQGDVLLILTGSATSDLHDDGPEAVRRAGGTVARFGMPVDPGNLLFHGKFGGRPVIGLPGCARSPALNGADWVLERIACGLDISDDDIAAMGVGGLLKEIPIRPQPREG
ncbi:molybdopterin-binding protein [Ostreiculturibacter nitratireducens]|uniref:molybdopterin-binding protein n=1 Tax=Ostreiculturibacter nitratireducens TaxID=3075226 RepID=UPI0031B5BF6C